MRMQRSGQMECRRKFSAATGPFMMPQRGKEIAPTCESAPSRPCAPDLMARPRSKFKWRMLAAASLLAVAAVTAAIWLKRRPNPAPAVRTILQTPAGVIPVSNSGIFGPPGISPDGRHLAFVGRAGTDLPRLYLYDLTGLDSSKAQGLKGTENACWPFWSPDDRNIGFFADGKLKTVDLSGAAVQTICELPSSRGFGGTWRGETILFGSSEGPIYRVSPAHGRPAAVTRLDLAAGEVRHICPWFLPDGEHFLFLDVTRDPDKRAIWAASLDGSGSARVLAENSNSAYAAGHLFFSRDEQLMAQPFDAGTLRVTGEASAVATGLLSAYTGGQAAFSVSNGGRVVYSVGWEGAPLIWLSSAGQVQGTAAPVGDYWGFGVSPDGMRLAVAKRDRGSSSQQRVSSADLWVIETGRGEAARLTSGTGVVRGAVWSPDGKQIAFARFRFDGSADLSVVSSTGSGQRVLANPVGVPTSWSQDGRWLAFTELNPGRSWDLEALDLATRKVVPVLETRFGEWQGEFSPDGRWMAYVSNESGTPEIYMRSFPGGEQKKKISNAGGERLAWSPEGDRLFYDSGGNVMAVGLKFEGKDVYPEPPVALFSLPPGSSRAAPGPQTGPGMRVSREGRFLVERSPVEKHGSTMALIDWR